MPSGELRAIIFDIGRVLVRVDIARAMTGLAAGLSLSPAELWAAIEKDPRWPDWQEGRMSPRDWHLHLNRRLGTSLTFERFTDVWNLALDPHPMQDDDLFEALARSYRLGLLSNTDPIHVAHLESTYGFFRFFPGPKRTYSCAVGASKPSPVIYQEALRSCRAKASEAVYVDDVGAYVEAAQRLGMIGIQYQSPTQLKNDFRNLGIDLL